MSLNALVLQMSSQQVGTLQKQTTQNTIVKRIGKVNKSLFKIYKYNFFIIPGRDH